MNNLRSKINTPPKVGEFYKLYLENLDPAMHWQHVKILKVELKPKGVLMQVVSDSFFHPAIGISEAETYHQWAQFHQFWKPLHHLSLRSEFDNE